MSLQFNHVSNLDQNEIEFIINQHSSDQEQNQNCSNHGILGIHSRNKEVLWYSNSGNKVIRKFSLRNTPIDAKFCRFSNTNHSENSSLNNHFLYAIAILSLNNNLQIHLYTGELYEIQLPFAVTSMHAVELGGLFFQKCNNHDLDMIIINSVLSLQCDSTSPNILNDKTSSLTNFYYLSHPLSYLTLVSFDINKSIKNDLFNVKVLSIHKDLVCIYLESTHEINIFQLKKIESIKTTNKTLNESLNHTMNSSDVDTTNSYHLDHTKMIISPIVEDHNLISLEQASVLSKNDKSINPMMVSCVFSNNNSHTPVNNVHLESNRKGYLSDNTNNINTSPRNGGLLHNLNENTNTSMMLKRNKPFHSLGKTATHSTNASNASGKSKRSIAFYNQKSSSTPSPSPIIFDSIILDSITHPTHNYIASVEGRASLSPGMLSNSSNTSITSSNHHNQHLHSLLGVTTSPLESIIPGFKNTPEKYCNTAATATAATESKITYPQQQLKKEIKMTFLVEIKINFPKSNHNLQVSLTDSSKFMTGIGIHVLDSLSGFYSCYMMTTTCGLDNNNNNANLNTNNNTIINSNTSNKIEEEDDEDQELFKIFYENKNKVQQISNYHTELTYSNYNQHIIINQQQHQEEDANSLLRYKSIAHCSISLDDLNDNLILKEDILKVLPTCLHNDTILISATILLHHHNNPTTRYLSNNNNNNNNNNNVLVNNLKDNKTIIAPKITIMIGSYYFQSTCFNWINDFEDIIEDLPITLLNSIQTINQNLPYIALIQKDGSMSVLSLSTNILSSSSIHPIRYSVKDISLSNPTNHTQVLLSMHEVVMNIIQTLVFYMKDIKASGLIEHSLAFILSYSHEIGFLSTIFLLLCASYGIQYEILTQYIQVNQNTLPDLLRFLEFNRTLLEISYINYCTMVKQHSILVKISLGFVLFKHLHLLIQEYILRYSSSELEKSRSYQDLISMLTQFLQFLQQIMINPLGQLDNMLHIHVKELLDQYQSYYLSSISNKSEKCLNIIQWYQNATISLNNHTQIEIGLPYTSTLQLSYPYKTLKITEIFFQYIQTINNNCNENFYKHSSAMLILDAYIASIHGVEYTYPNRKRLDPNSFPSDNTVITSMNYIDWSLTISYFPYLIRILLELSIKQCKDYYNPFWPNYLLVLIERNDLCDINTNKRSLLLSKSSLKSDILLSGSNNETFALNTSTTTNNTNTSSTTNTNTTNTKGIASDGLYEVENTSHLRFTADDRLHEVCRMLRSSEHIYIKIEKPPDVSELDHRHKQQMKLLLLCRRTLACPIGRGMLTMSSLAPLMAEILPIPALRLTGRIPPNNSIITLDTSTASADLTLWPDFHNGVAASLRLNDIHRSTLYTSNHNSSSSSSSTSPMMKVTRNWIIYNRTASQANPGGESSHAGLGLKGHLTTLTVTDTCEYLIQGHEPTTIAILIGMAASKLGSADSLLSKTISLHLPALLPMQHWDIEISPLVQTAALISLGLLHCGSGHRLMSEFLLAELSRRTSSDRCESREAMLLAAAWSLGMVLLGKGNKNLSNRNDSIEATTATTSEDSLRGLADLRIEDRLLQQIEGGKRPSDSKLFPIYSNVDMSSKSSRVLDGEEINTNITAPGAIIALSLIYIRSNSIEILQRLAIPTIIITLDVIRPDILIYRALGICLIQWDAVIPSEDWINSQIPIVILKSLSLLPEADSLNDSNSSIMNKENNEKQTIPTTTNKKNLLSTNKLELDPRIALALYLSCISGFCYGIGIVFAGTSDILAYKTLLHYLKLLQGFRDNKPSIKLSFPLDKNLKYTIESCTCLISLSLACVMAGSGDLACLRIFRELRWKIEDVGYGSHMALSMSLGLLFLGGGNYSLRRDPLSAACLLLSICPRYPLRTIDHQYHLQPLRHLYVLATESRALHTIDIHTGLPVSVNIEAELINGKKILIKAPTLLPELVTVKKVSVINNINSNNNENPLKKLLNLSSITANKDTMGINYYSNTTIINPTINKNELKHAINNDFKITNKHLTIDIPLLFVKSKHQNSNENTIIDIISNNNNRLKITNYNNMLIKECLESIYDPFKLNNSYNKANYPISLTKEVNIVNKTIYDLKLIELLTFFTSSIILNNNENNMMYVQMKKNTENLICEKIIMCDVFMNIIKNAMMKL